LTYYVIGFDPNVGRLFKQYLLLLAVNQMAAAIFRFIGGVARNMIVANVFASFMLLVVMVLGGFILVREKNKEMVDLGLLDLPNDVCAECHFGE